jgi:predicted RNA-binding protein with PUA-like domain
MLRAEPALAGMVVLRPGTRLSVQPVTPDEFKKVTHMGNKSRADRTSGAKGTKGTR